MYYIAQTVFTSNDLKHYGVAGMKWGVRRALTNMANNYDRNAAYAYNHEAKTRINLRNQRLKTAETVKKAKKEFRKTDWNATKQLAKDTLTGHAIKGAKKYYNTEKKAQADYRNTTKSSKQKLRSLRKQNLKNMASVALVSPNPAVRGAYYQNRKNGNSIAKSMVTTSSLADYRKKR